MVAWLRPFAPRVIATAVVVLSFLGIALACRAIALALSHAGHHPTWLLLVLAPAFVCTFVGIERIGLREFYRRRIAAAFLLFPGATRGDVDWLEGVKAVPKEEPPREPRPSDFRPVHLVCCAANDTGSDPLPTLYRGARSAVLSRRGLGISDCTRRVDVRLSEALTASAAAFNTQMGGLSLRIGRSVSFLMGALGLRLGMWVRGPGERRRGLLRLAGLRFFAEMLGLTRSDPRAGWVHLSDGGHFDNLALYELVRRHCRYVIVSDCGADPDVRFDDLSDVIRRVREDFGVEIDIDVGPLRKNDAGVSRQHIVVGTIYYDGRRGRDRGVLMLIKPTLVGDEPPDVVQYRDRNSAFPHESTGDQFFDEPQWESYRRLGEHCGGTAFAFVEELPETDRSAPERIFPATAHRWNAVRRP